MNNPMYGRKHSPKTREKMSMKAKARAEEVKRWRAAKTLQELLTNHPSIGEYLRHLVKQQIRECVDFPRIAGE